jgi:hypothetical protein
MYVYLLAIFIMTRQQFTDSIQEDDILAHMRMTDQQIVTRFRG